MRPYQEEKFGVRGIGRLPTPGECELALAHAIRKARELQFHLGVEPRGEILIWEPDEVCVLVVNDKTVDDESRGRSV